ncbi:MAG TPA: hypothetical protein VKF37_16805 [Chloroflexota bacterium]|nr:hypothetical protein [Chloroflexota bacterium]
MVVGTILAAAMVKPVDVATVGVVMVGLVSAAAFAVRMRRRRASQPGGGDAGGPGADGGSADQAASASRGHDRWHHLMGGLEANLDAKRYSSPTTNAQSSALPGAAAPDRGDRPRVDATRFGGLASAARTPAQTGLFGPDALDDDQAVADHSVDGPTGSLLALPPATRAAPDADGHPASHTLERVRACLSAVSTPQVVALSVIDSTGRVLAGATDDDVTGELRSLLAESGLGHSADLVQPLRFADDSRGAMLLLPTGANALLGALVRDTDDVQATRARLRGLAHEIGDAMGAAS